MANNRINRYIGAIVLGTVLVAVPGCTDTWDDHYASDGVVSGTTATLWDQIKDNPNYSRFADIVRHAKYYKDNTHPVPTYSYEDILSGGQVNTVWVPDNSALSAQEYQKWMAMLTGESRADENGVNTAGYDVQQQFLGNHIALWRHNISEPGLDTVKMINGKNLEFDKTKLTFAGVPLGEKYNIPTANGVMHVLKGIAPFHYNFYEYLKYPELGKQRTKFGEYVVSKDTTYFSADSSIEGLPDENGNPTYVDSVYRTSNRLFESRSYLPSEGAEKWQMAEKGFAARINNEDSMFVMVMPTDAAWDATYAMLEPAYVYAYNYDNKSKGDLGTKEAIKFTTKEELDSLREMSIKMDMISPLVFNINKQPKVGGEMWTLKKFDELKGEGAEYLLNTFGDTLRAVDNWQPSSLFDGDLIEMSNGNAYEVSAWNFPPEYYTPDVEVEIENTGVFYNTESTKYKVGPGTRRFSFSNETYKIITDKYGNVSNNNFFLLESPNATSVPKAEVKLVGNSPTAYVPNAQVMSGKYDIQVVVVPYWYMQIASSGGMSEFIKIDTLVDEFDETDTTFSYRIDEDLIASYAHVSRYKFKATLSYTNNKSNASDNTQLSSTILYDGLKVDTLTVIENFEFPYSYKNMRFSYPTLYIEGATTKSDANPKVTDANPNPPRYVYDLVIDKIILKRKN